jgi:hypothetical protein
MYISAVYLEAVSASSLSGSLTEASDQKGNSLNRKSSLLLHGTGKFKGIVSRFLEDLIGMVTYTGLSYDIYVTYFNFFCFSNFHVMQ